MRIRFLFSILIGTSGYLFAASCLAQNPPPPKTPATDAYLFRLELTGDSKCQEIGRKSDDVFLDNKLSWAQKISQLDQLHADATAIKCFQQKEPF